MTLCAGGCGKEVKKARKIVDSVVIKVDRKFCSDCRYKNQWNKGLTIETDERVKKNHEHSVETAHKLQAAGEWKNPPSRFGTIPWNVGLNKETDIRIKQLSVKVSETISQMYRNGQLKNTGTGKCGYRADLTNYCRSRWEANVCRILKYQGIEYQYEPKTFKLITTTYTPDLFIPKENLWLEIKGYNDANSQRKNNEFSQLYPNETLILIEKEEYQILMDIFKDKIPNLEV